METRVQTLRRRHRQIFRWSLGIAAVVHAVVLYYGPWFRSDSMSGGGTELVEGETTGRNGIPVDAHFGPPAIEDADGALAQEPPERVLHASRLIPPPVGCESLDWLAAEAAIGEVRLVVTETGRADSVQLSRSTGDRCWDGIMTGLASDLLYRWLPSERFPAPVWLFQPVTLSPADG